MKQNHWFPLLSSSFVLMLVIIPLAIGYSLARVGSRSSLALSQAVLHSSHSNQERPDIFHLDYHGGPVMPGTVEVYPIFWFPSSFPNESEYVSLIERYYKDVGGNRLYNILSQYTAGNGFPSTASFSSSNVWEYTDPGNTYPHNPVTDLDIQKEVRRAIAFNHWPMSGYDYYFPVYVSQSGCYAIHNFAGPQDNPLIFAHILYPDTSQSACQPPGGSPNNYPQADIAISLSAHEQFEAATDPTSASTWITFGQLEFEEVADECEGVYGSLNTDGSNQIWNGDHYIIQEMWSNNAGSCTQG